MTATDPPVTRRPADRKSQLVALAAQLFGERGYSHVSVADIAKAAGVTGPSVYRHFADKQALLAAAVLAGVDDLEACTDRALDRADGLAPEDPARLDGLVDSICTMGIRRPDAAVLWRWNGAFLSDDQNREVATRTTAVLARWARALQVGRADLDDRGARQLAWAALSIAGSTSMHATRIPAARAHARLRLLITRVVSVRTADAPLLETGALPGPEPMGRRDEILDASSDLFERRGFGNVGVDEIGEAVGITGPSVYRHFSSKVAILTSIGQRSAARLEAGAMAAHAASRTPHEFLSRLADSYVTVLTATPDLAVAFHNGTVLRDVDARDLLAAQRQYVRRWIELVCEIDPGLPRAEAAVTVHAALSIANDAMRMRRGRDRPELPGQLALMMKGVLGL
ncbi:TetR/AcrR family transcriptional regulator [Williamsia herbipolensis]|uniref:TetR/AcrR family transcriptional regulator n=1 Tax=Williamsia herbipolensis TaxID=1603258 RepID=A0AAU4JWZ8_9NOCA|nr:TetR/AcrR family transcriptional regulator [Williamsia herbipolensis]